jgi:hypothetical protein
MQLLNRQEACCKLFRTAATLQALPQQQGPHLEAEVVVVKVAVVDDLAVQALSILGERDRQGSRRWTEGSVSSRGDWGTTLKRMELGAKAAGETQLLVKQGGGKSCVVVRLCVVYMC